MKINLVTQTCVNYIENQGPRKLKKQVGAQTEISQKITPKIHYFAQSVLRTKWDINPVCLVRLIFPQQLQMHTQQAATFKF